MEVRMIRVRGGCTQKLWCVWLVITRLRKERFVDCIVTLQLNYFCSKLS